MKAALEAWGADSNLFHQGVAKESDDPGVVAATMSKPDVILGHPVGSDGPFSEDADLPTHLSSDEPNNSPKKARAKSRNQTRRAVDDNEARKASLVYVPADVGFATKPKLATRMIVRAIAASVPFRWVAGDTVYGVGNIEQQLRRAGKGYVLGVSSTQCFDPGASDRRSPVRLQTSPGRGTHPTGSACRRAPEPRTAAARLVLSRIGRSRGRAVQQCK